MDYIYLLHRYQIAIRHVVLHWRRASL